MSIINFRGEIKHFRVLLSRLNSRTKNSKVPFLKWRQRGFVNNYTYIVTSVICSMGKETI